VGIWIKWLVCDSNPHSRSNIHVLLLSFSYLETVDGL